MRIALDAMGGDDAPGINIQGALQALEQWDHLEIDLVGPKSLLEEQLTQQEGIRDRLSIVHADDYVGMHEKPTDAIRHKPDASMFLCWKLMAEKQVQAVVSAGNTGAVVAGGLRTRLFLKQVKRPGIAVILPTLTGPCVMMDVGANPAARADHLYQYGVMGAVYAREMLGIESPRVGLLNIGSEDGKGNDLVREAHGLLAGSALKDQYVGNVEGRGVYQGEADVVVCDGFVGNVVLKVSEGLADMMFRVLSREVIGSLDQEQDRAKLAIQNAAQRFEYRETGGAPLLGIDGLCMISHGSSNGHAMKNALGSCVKMSERQVNSLMVEQLSVASEIE